MSYYPPSEENIIAALKNGARYSITVGRDHHNEINLAGFEICARCQGSGFDSNSGNGYDNACSECGGQRYLPIKPQPRRTGMNYSTAVFALNKNLRAILAVYDPGASPSAQAGKKVMFKTLDPSIVKDDIIVVPTDTRHGMTCVKVTDVDVDVDLDDGTPVAWVIARVDTLPWITTVKDEQKAIDLIKAADFRNRKAKIRDSITANAEELKALPIYQNGDDAKPVS